MHIGITVQSTTLPEQEQRRYLLALLEDLPTVAPQHTFTFITDDSAPTVLFSLKMLPAPLATGYFSLRQWYGKTLPALLQKGRIDALITINGSLSDSSIPQVPVFVAPAAAVKACNTWLQFLYKRYLAKCLQKATTIGSVTNRQWPEMRELFGLKADQLFETGYAIPAIYQSVDDWQQREIFLQQQTGGKEYFLFTGSFSEDQFLHLLKAFSLFKKRQQSNMQLLVPANFAIDKKLQEKLDTYKYRQDVQFVKKPDNGFLPLLTACAYAVLFMEENSTTAFPVATAIQCHVPVIGFETNEALPEVVGEAALYADASVESLAEQMKLIYKDESLRQQLIFHSRQRAVQVSGREAARKILSRLKAV